MKRTCLFKDLLGRIGVGNICLDEMSALRETLAELGAIHADHAPAIGGKVTYRCASNSPSRASDENSFCHSDNFFQFRIVPSFRVVGVQSPLTHLPCKNFV